MTKGHFWLDLNPYSFAILRKSNMYLHKLYYWCWCFCIYSQEWMDATAILMNTTCPHFSVWVHLLFFYPGGQSASPTLAFFGPFETKWLVSLYFQMFDPVGIANWSVTHVDWSEGKWHPKSYTAQDITVELLKNITVRFCFPNILACLLISLSLSPLRYYGILPNYLVTDLLPHHFLGILIVPLKCMSIDWIDFP